MQLYEPFTITLNETAWANTTIVRKGVYAADDTAALSLITDGWEPLADVTLCLPEAPTLAAGCVWVKSWGEVAGLVEELARLGIAVRTGRTFVTGPYGTTVHEMRLVAPFDELVEVGE